MNLPQLQAIFDEIRPMGSDFGKTGRYDYAKAKRGEKWYFIKNARNLQHYNGIQRQVVWWEFMSRVEAFYPDSGFRAAKMDRRIGRSGLVYEFIDGHVLGTPDAPEALLENLERYASMLETFDKVAINWKSENLPDEPSRTARPYDIWLEWLGENADRVENLELARQQVEQIRFSLKTCMQHGDLTPWQVFVSGDSWIVVDGESSGTDLFRFNDLAYSFAQLYTQFAKPDAARQLLKYFIQHHGEPRDEFLEQFMPVLTHRTVGIISDAYNDQLKRDYVHAAEELLYLCVTDDAQAILA